MDDAVFVRGFECVRDQSCDRQGLIDRNRTFCDAIGQCRPFDQFEHERRGAVRALEAVDGCDVGVVQRGEDFGFALKPR